MTTYCILNSNNTVTSTFADSQLPTNQPGYIEIPVDNGQVGQTWTGSDFVAGPIVVPQNLTAYQAKLALSNAELYAAVNSYVETNGTEPEKIGWENQQTYTRSDAMLIAVMTAIGQTSSQIDALFIAAAQLSP